MDTHAQHLLSEALKLPADTREDLAVRLMGTVEPTEAQAAEVKQAWDEEIDRREARLQSGELSPVPVDDAWQKITGSPWRGQSTAE